MLQKIDNKKSASDEQLYSRSFQIDDSFINKKDMTITLSFASEKPVMRWFGREYLKNTPDAVDLSPIVDAGSILMNHNPQHIIAKPLRVWVDATERKSKAIIQFSNNIEESKKAFNLVKEGMLRGTSVFYSIDGFKEIGNAAIDGFEGPGRLVTNWSVREITLTPIPADASVGVGRTMEGNMEVKKGEGNENKKTTEDIDVKKNEELITAERKRVSDILELARSFNEPADEYDKYIESGTAVADVKSAILEKLAKRNKAVSHAEVGKSETEKISEAMTDAVLLRAGFKVEKPTSGADNFRGMSLMEMAKYTLRKRNISDTGDVMSIASRALGLDGSYRDGTITHTTSDFPTILANVANKVLQKAYSETPTKYQRSEERRVGKECRSRWSPYH